jgi:hypothetical protein
LAALAARPAEAQVIGGVGSSPLVGSAWVGAPMPYNFAYGGGMAYPAFGYGGYGTGYYGGAGYYGGFGYGYPGVGYGFGGIGMTAADQWMTKYQNYALNASRYNLQNAETATMYQAANLLHQQALQTLMQNYAGNYLNDKYAGMPYGGRPMSYGGGAGADGAKVLPPEQLYTRDGRLLWPLGAPDGGDLKAKKQAADDAVQRAVGDYIASRAAPPVREVVAARSALADYANSAAREIKENRPDDYKDFTNYIDNVDASLRSLADVAHNGARPRTGPKRTPADVVGGIDTDPKGTPKSAGDVLKEKVQSDRGDSGSGANAPDRPSPGEQPPKP